MATQGERRALFFLAAVALLGAGVRAWRSRQLAVDSLPLDQQIAAVDSAGLRGPRGRPRKPTVGSAASAIRNPPAATRVDIDTAAVTEIEKLPGIGPALAKRIVKDRETNGRFGCLAALDRVKGIGPALMAKIDSLATFSAAGGAPCASEARPPAGLPRR